MDSQAELLGPLLVEEKLLVPEQLELALQFAASTGLPLDQIVVAEFAVPQPDISRLLAQMDGGSDMSNGHDVDAPTEGPRVRPLGFRIRRPIGQIFVDLGFITADDREAALNVQRERGGLLGEILIEQGKLTRLELANALSEHWESASGGPDTTPTQGLPVVEAAAPSGSPPSADASSLAQLRRSLAELDAARVADAQAVKAQIAAIDEALAARVPHDDAEFRRTTNDRLQELADTIASAGNGSAGAVDLGARLDALAGSTSELRSELEALASRQVDPEPDERVNELTRTIDALVQSLDDRLATLAADLRTEIATRTDDSATQLRAQTDELTASIAVLHESIAGAKHQADTWADESRTLATRIDDLDESRATDAEAATTANDQIREQFAELIALRTADLETTQAAHAQAAAETSRIEHVLRSELEALASRQVDHEPDERVDELTQTIDALTQSIDDRLATLATDLRAETTTRTDDISAQLGNQAERVEEWRTADAEAARTASGQLHARLDELVALRATDLEATQAAQAEATRAAAEAARIENALRSELEALASRPVDADQSEIVNDLKQTLDALTQSIDDRLATLASELRAETTTRTDDIATQLANQAERVEEWRTADAEAARMASGQLGEQLTELIALQTTDVEATAAAQAEATRAVAEAARIEHVLRSELEALASRQVDHEPDERVDELTQTIDALTQSIDDRLATLATDLRAETATRSDNIATQLRDQAEKLERSRAADAKAAKSATGQLHEQLTELIALRATDLELTQAARADAAQAAAEAARIEQTLRSELEMLASRHVASEPGADVNDLTQTIDALAQSMDDRLATLAADLRAETATRTDDSATQLRAQTDELAASITALRETVASGNAETKKKIGTWADESRTLATRIDDLNESGATEAEAAKVANDELREQLAELIALRANDLEATQAAQAQAAQAATATTRIEQTLVGALAELAVQVDELKTERSGQSLTDDNALVPDHGSNAKHSDARKPKADKKKSKRTKGKKKPKH